MVRNDTTDPIKIPAISEKIMMLPTIEASIGSTIVGPIIIAFVDTNPFENANNIIKIIA